MRASIVQSFKLLNNQTPPCNFSQTRDITHLRSYLRTPNPNTNILPTLFTYPETSLPKVIRKIPPRSHWSRRRQDLQPPIFPRSFTTPTSRPDTPYVRATPTHRNHGRHQARRARKHGQNARCLCTSPAIEMQPQWLVGDEDKRGEDERREADKVVVDAQPVQGVQESFWP